MLFTEFFLAIITSIIVGGSTGCLIVCMGIVHYEKTIARTGDDNGSIIINGIWYVIKREGR